MAKKKEHLYRGTKKHRGAEQAKFTKRYGKKGGKKNKGGKYVYGAVVGEAYRKAHHGKNWNQKK